MWNDHGTADKAIEILHAEKIEFDKAIGANYYV
jgi:hypothetical protein